MFFIYSKLVGVSICLVFEFDLGGVLIGMRKVLDLNFKFVGFLIFKLF